MKQDVKLLPPARDVDIVSALHPFKTETVLARTEAGQTLAEALGKPRKEVHVEVDGETVAVEDFDDYVLQAGQLVTVRVIPEGGDDGSKVLRSVMQIAVVALSLAVQAIPGVGQIAGYALSATVLVGGNLVVDAVVPPPTIGADPRGKRPDFERLGSLTGSRNRLAQGAPVPRVYGKRKMFPPMSSKPYTEVVGNVQYLRMLFNVGYGPVQLSNPKIGETAIGSFDSDNNFTSNGNFESVQIDVAEEPSLFSRNIGENSVSATMNDNADEVIRTTEPDTDEISVDFVFPRGLYKIDSNADVQPAQVKFMIEYRESGTTNDWINAMDPDDSQLVNNTDNYTPQYEEERDISRDFAREDYVETSPDVYEQGFVAEGDEPETLRVGVKWQPENAGQYDVRIRRMSSTSEGSEETVFKDTTWTVLRSIHYEKPTNLPNTVQIAMRIRSTDQLTGVLDNFSVEVESYLATYDGNQWLEPTFDPATGSDSGNGTLTDNPAWVYADVLSGNANPNPIPKSRIDADAVNDWADFCSAEGFGFNAPIDARITVLELMNDVCSTGRASFTIQDGLYSVAIDREKTLPAQAFTPRNSANFSGSRTFRDMPHALRVKFVNPDANWELDERIVYDDGYDETNATEFETMELGEVTSAEQAWKMGRYYLAVMKLRLDTYKLTTDVENIVCHRGDLVTVNHDVPLFGSGFGRVKSVTLDGSGNVTEIQIDDSVIMESGKDYVIRIRKNDNSQSTYNINESVGEFTNLVLDNPTSDNIQAGDLFLFGEVSKESQEMIVKDIDAGTNFEAELTLVDHAPAIFDADSGTIPAYDSNISEPVDIEDLKPPAPTIDSVRSDETAITKDVDGTIGAKMIASFTLDGGFPSAEVEARWRRENVGDGWIGSKNVEASNGKIAMEDVQVGKSYIFQLRTVNGDRSSGWVTSQPHTIVGKEGNPSDVENFSVTLDQVDLKMHWDEIGDTDLQKYEIRKGSDWDSGTLIGYNDGTELTISVTTTGQQTYWIKAIDTAGNKSLNAVSTTVDVPSDFLDDVVKAGGSSILSDIELNSGNPYLDFIETDVANKNWRLRALGGNFVFEERDDGDNIVGTWLELMSGGDIHVGGSKFIDSSRNITAGTALFDIGNKEFRIKNGSSMFVLDGSTGQIGLGADPSDDVGLLLDTPARSVTANSNYDRLKVTNNGVLTVSANTTSPFISTAQFNEPNINLASGASVTHASTVYIESAPTEGDNNYALYAPSGLTLLENLEVTGTINYVNEDNLQVEDKTITVNKNGTDTSADGSGLIIERPSGNRSILWDSSNGFVFDDKIKVEDFAGAVFSGNVEVVMASRGTNAFQVNDPDYPSLGRVILQVDSNGNGEIVFKQGNNDTWGKIDADTTYFNKLALGTNSTDGHRLLVDGSAKVNNGLDVNGTLNVEKLFTVQDDIYPSQGYVSNIGSPSKKFLSAHIAELRVSTLVSAEERVTTGGRFLVGQSTELTSDIGTGATSIDVKHNNLGSGDILQFEARGQLEFMEVTSSASGTGPYTYSVTRDLDGTGANAWEAGDAVFNTGQTGEGFLDLFAINSITQDTSTSGPTIAHMVRTGSSYNAIEPRAVSGNLKGFYGIGSNTWGFGAGDPNSEHIIVDPTDGISMFSGSNLTFQANGGTLQIGSSGNFEYTASTDTLVAGGWTINPTRLSGDNVDIWSTGTIQHTSGAWELHQDGSGYLANGNITWSANDPLITAGNVKLGSGVDGGTADGLHVSSGTFIYGDESFSFAGGIFQGNSSSITGSGWSFNDDRIVSPSGLVKVRSDRNTIGITVSGASGSDIQRIYLGDNYYNGSSWISESGLTAIEADGGIPFQLTKSTKQIAGWNYKTNRLESPSQSVIIYSDNGYDGEINVNGDYWRGDGTINLSNGSLLGNPESISIMGSLGVGNVKGVGNTFLADELDKNRISYSEEISSWNPYNGGNDTTTFEENAGIAPNGTKTADLVICDGGSTLRSRSMHLLAGKTYTISFWAKSNSGSFSINPSIRLSNSDFFNGSEPNSVTIDGEWKRYSVTVKNTYSAGNRLLFLSVSNTNEYYLWGVQVEEGTQATSYAKNGTSSSKNDTHGNNSVADPYFGNYSGTVGTGSENSFDDWNTREDSGDAEFYVVSDTPSGDISQSFMYRQATAPSSAYRHQVMTDGHDNEEGAKYYIEFWAKASIGGSLLGVRDDGSSKGGLGKTVSLGTSWQQYTYEWVDNGDSDSIRFFLGYNSADKYITGVKVHKIYSPSYGMWASKGGFGGTAQDPVVEITSSGIQSDDFSIINGTAEFSGQLISPNGDIGGWDIKNGRIEADGDNQAFVQMISGNRPEFHFRAKNGEDLHIGGDYSFDNEEDITVTQTNFNPNLTDENFDASNGTNNGANDTCSYNFSNPSSLEGRNLRFTTSQTISVSVINLDGESQSASASCDLRFRLIDSNGNIISGYEWTDSDNVSTSDGQVFGGASLTVDVEIPSGVDFAGVEVYWSLNASTAGSNTSASASMDVDEPPVTIIGTAEFISPLGFSFVEESSSQNRKPRILGRRSNGELLAHHVVIEGSNGSQFTLEISEGSNPQLIVRDENGSQVDSFG